MARALNIERRRKQARLYRQKRKLRSPMRRFIHFMWGPLILVSLVVLLLGALAVEVLSARWSSGALKRPQASLRWVRVPAGALERAVRVGSVRHHAGALRDEDLGIALRPVAPEVEMLRYHDFAPIGLQEVPERVAGAASILPSAVRVVTAGSRVRVQMDRALREASLQIDAPKNLTERGHGLYWASYDQFGVPEEVLRLEPRGVEGKMDRAWRLMIERSRALKAAEGFIRIDWQMEGGKK